MAENRKIVIPGETIVTGGNYLPSDGTYRDNEDVVAMKYGLASIDDQRVKVIPLSGKYFPRRGNTIIGTIVDITMNGWLIDFGAPGKSFLSLNEVPRYINKNELRDFLDFGDSVVVKIWNIGARGIDVSMKMRGFGRIEGGMLIDVNPNKVPRIIGKEGSMVRLIRGATNCNLTVGQNGKVWIRGDSLDNEINVRKIVEYIVENSAISGLTEKVENFIKGLGLTVVKEERAPVSEEVKGEEIVSNDENKSSEDSIKDEKVEEVKMEKTE